MIPTLAISRGLAVLTVLAVAGLPGEARAASRTFQSLSGSWGGGGTATFEGGQSERLRCTASYRAAAGGADLSLAIRCASASAKVDLRASLAQRGGQVTGTWEERQFNIGGGAAGRVTVSDIRLNFSGGLTGGMSVTLNGSNSHSVSISAQGSNLRAVSIALSRRLPAASRSAADRAARTYS